MIQAGKSFEGPLLGGTIRCATSGLWISVEIGTDIVLNGLIDRGVISFDIGNSDFHHRGAATGVSIEGTTLMRVDLGTSIMTLTGRFTARRM